MPKKQPGCSGFTLTDLNIYDRSLIPLAAVDSSLKLVYKNEAFTGLFGIRKGANIKHITKVGSSAEQVFDNLKSFEIPVLSETGDFYFNVTLITVPLREFGNSDLFLLVTADAKLLMDVMFQKSSNAGLGNDIVNISAAELKSIYNKYINPYICHVVSIGSLENIVNKTERHKITGNITRLKKLEMFMYTELQRSIRFRPGAEYARIAIRPEALFNRISETVKKCAPHGYEAVSHIENDITAITVKSGYDFAGFLICATLFIYRISGVKSISLWMTKQEERICVQLCPTSKVIPQYQSAVIIKNFQRIISERDIEFMERCAASLDASFNADIDNASITLKFNNVVASAGELMLYDPILTARHMKMADEVIDAFALILSLYNDELDLGEV